MRNHQIAVGLIGILVAVVVLLGFTVIGSPVSQQIIRYDETRYSDFQQIKVQVENYYSNNETLPTELTDINFNNLNLNDPISNQPYEYKVVDEDDYQLCTEFATEAESFRQYSSNTYYDIPIKHTKGYSCIDLIIPAYIKNQSSQRAN